MYCRNCGNGMEPQAVFCVKCGVPTGSGTNFCYNCGSQVDPNAAVCVKCGVALHQQPIRQGGQGGAEQKSKLVAGLLGIFLGAFGIHNFYLGYQKKALIQVLVSTIGGIITCGIATFAIEIWGLVEGIMILTGKIAVDGKGIPLKE